MQMLHNFSDLKKINSDPTPATAAPVGIESPFKLNGRAVEAFYGAHMALGTPEEKEKITHFVNCVEKVPDPERRLKLYTQASEYDSPGNKCAHTNPNNPLRQTAQNMRDKTKKQIEDFKRQHPVQHVANKITQKLKGPTMY